MTTLDDATKEAMIERILRAAIDCVHEFGMDELQITQIAARAGVSTRTVHRYFSDKSDMLSAAVRLYLKDRYGELTQRYYDADKQGMTGRDRLLFFMRTQQTYYKKDVAEAIMFVDMNLFRVRHEREGEPWDMKGVSEIAKIIVDNLNLGIADGSIKKDLDIARAATLISSSYNGVMQRLAAIYRSSLSERDKARMFPIFDDYLSMIEGWLK